MKELASYVLLQTIRLARKEGKPLANITLKLNEEVGELSEAVNYLEGYLPHKTMKEELIGEVADVVQCALTVLVKTEPKISDEELLLLFLEMLEYKNSKWGSLI
jgi:NTP pyrophosphatase (non-canonical NTP hydrolase)